MALDKVGTYAKKIRKKKGIHAKQVFYEDIHVNINFERVFTQI